MTTDPVLLAERLIECPSVTPAAGLVFDALQAMLEPLGSRCTASSPAIRRTGRWKTFRDPPGPQGSRHFAFAGHVDVVPPGEAGAARLSWRNGAAICCTGAARWT
jgi:succinyl-diaminopimelate desuccinylase